MTHRFVVLGYTQDVKAELGIEIAVATAPLDDGHATSPLTLQIADGWQEMVAPDDRSYVAAVFQDLAEESTADIIAAITHLSSGCLRTNRAGVCDRKELPKLLLTKHRLSP